MSRVFLNTNTQNIIWYNTIMLERTMHLATILLLVKCRFQNQWSNGKHNAKVRTVNQSYSTASQYECLCKVFCNHCCTEKYMSSFWDTHLIFELTVTFFVSIFLYLSVVNFTPIVRVLVTETQSLVMFHSLWKRERPFWGDLILA